MDRHIVGGAALVLSLSSLSSALMTVPTGRHAIGAPSLRNAPMRRMQPPRLFPEGPRLWQRRRRKRSLELPMSDAGCNSEEECEIVYDDDEPLPSTGTTTAVREDNALNSDSFEKMESEGLQHRKKVLEDGYEKQSLLKWREAEVVANDAASVDEKCRLLTLSLVLGDGLEHEFSKAAWMDNYKVPGQFVGLRLDDARVTGVAGCLVAVATDPTWVRRTDGRVQVLVTEESTFRLKGDTRGPAEEAEGCSLAALKVHDRLRISDFVGRGFASLLVGWIGLQSAVQEQRDIVIAAAGARGLGSIKPVLDWPPIQAHAGIKKVTVYLETESADSTPFLKRSREWMSAGIRVIHCFTSGTPGKPTSIEEALFGGSDRLADGPNGGTPQSAAFLMAGLSGQRAMALTDRLTDEGVDASRLLFNDFF